MRTKILLDTDIGTDIDDSVCLAYLLTQPRCDLLGITTVSGESEKRAMMVSAICKTAKKDVPIYPGVENPLLIPQRQTVAQQAVKLKNWPHETRFPKGKAVTFLRDMIHANPGEVTLLTIGPLTNAALLFSTYPETAGLLKEMVLMGGLYTNRLSGLGEWGPAEWNILLDPHAAAIVFHAPVPKFHAIGLDVTTQVTMDSRELKKKCTAAVLQPVVDFSAVWFHERPFMTFHDPLAATVIFDKNICAFESGEITVELTSPQLQGFTLWNQSKKNSTHHVAVAVHADRFFDHYFGVFQ